MRERLDQIDPRQLRRPFKQIFSHLQRGKALESYRYLEGHYILSLDGTEQFSSEKVHCKQCCSKNDCERSAAKRLLGDFRREHLHLKTRVRANTTILNFPVLDCSNDL